MTLKEVLAPLPTPANVTVAALDQVIGQILSWLPLLPERQLSAQRKCALAAYLFIEGPLVVHWLGAALRREPALFADMLADPAVNPDAMQEQMDVSDRWLSLRDAFLMLAERCDEQHALARGYAVRRALQLITRVREERERDLREQGRSSAAHEQRRWHLLPAISVLQAWQQRKRGV